jgi:hypothetical protein
MGFSFFWRGCAQDERRLIFDFPVGGIRGELCKTQEKVPPRSLAQIAAKTSYLAGKTNAVGWDALKSGASSRIQRMRKTRCGELML